MLKFQRRTVLTAINPKLSSHYQPQVPIFHQGQQVLYRAKKGKPVQHGQVLQVVGKTTYFVDINGEAVLCSVNQLKPRVIPTIPDIPEKEKQAQLSQITTDYVLQFEKLQRQVQEELAKHSPQASSQNSANQPEGNTTSSQEAKTQDNLQPLEKQKTTPDVTPQDPPRKSTRPSQLLKYLTQDYVLYVLNL